MDRMLYVAMTGANQTMLAQTANSHNLANANTTGFRADLAAFRAMPVFGPGQPTRVYGMAERPGVNLASGTLTASGRDLDVAVHGDGWIAVQAADGSEAYTRAGDLRISESGVLVNGAGHPILGNGGPIALPPSEKVDIGGDGTISVRPTGQGATALVVADRIKLVKLEPQDIYKGTDGLMHRNDGLPAPADAAVNLVAGSLETSNVNVVEALVNMITLARQFEMQVKVMRTAEETDTASAQLMRLG